jgi:ATP-binding cassette subfamily B protein
MSMGAGGAAQSVMRSLARDSSVKDIKLKSETIPRIMQFAKPFKMYLIFFLLTIIADSFLTVAPPLLLKNLIDKGVIPKDGRVVTELALLVGVIALIDTGVNLVSRWFSSRIGEGLIYEMRTQVFAHIQRQSIAFFTRTQTGALISRINSDVIGAQNAFTNTLSGVLSNLLPRP